MLSGTHSIFALKLQKKREIVFLGKPLFSNSFMVEPAPFPWNKDLLLQQEFRKTSTTVDGSQIPNNHLGWC